MANVLQPLELYKVVAKTDIHRYIRGNLLTRDGWYHIGLRQTPEQAIEREMHMGQAFDKDDYAVLKVTFSVHGILHFATMAEDATYFFQPVFHKVLHSNSSVDKGVWHFTRDLPLSMSDSQGNELIWSEFFLVM